MQHQWQFDDISKRETHNIRDTNKKNFNGRLESNVYMYARCWKMRGPDTVGHKWRVEVANRNRSFARPIGDNGVKGLINATTFQYKRAL